MKRRTFLSLAVSYPTIGFTSSSLFSRYALASTSKPEIKAIAFDAFPLFDPRPILGLAKKLFPEAGEHFSKAWFNKIFAYTWLRTTGQQYKNFYEIIDDALTHSAQQFKVELKPDNRDQLLGAWTKLKPWPDVAEALQIFKNEGIRLAFLSNFTEEMLRINSKHSGIEDAFEFFLSTDKVSAFKPAPAAYQMGVDAFKLPKQNIAFAAFGAWDAVGATWFGYPTVWINRLDFTAENLDAGPITTGRSIATLTDFVKG